MPNNRPQKRAHRLALACCAAVLSCTFALSFEAGAARAQGQRADVRMRSFAPPASGRVTVEANEGGGSGRVTALSLPDPQTVAPGAGAYVVWALSEGRIVRLGELRRDERGNGGLAFERPAGFERYSVVVTAEPTAAAERPGSPVLSTRAAEVSALYSPLAKKEAAKAEDPDREESKKEEPKPEVAKPEEPARRPMRTRAASGPDFYGEVDDALAQAAGGRAIRLEGESHAPDARGEARATMRAGLAYVRANFRDVPLPDAVGASVYVLWAIIPDGRIVYMGSLPAGRALNLGETYVRVPGFDADDYTLFVTAERRRPAPAPSGRRVLSPNSARIIVK